MEKGAKTAAAMRLYGAAHTRKGEDVRRAELVSHIATQISDFTGDVREQGRVVAQLLAVLMEG